MVLGEELFALRSRMNEFSNREREARGREQERRAGVTIVVSSTSTLTGTTPIPPLTAILYKYTTVTKLSLLNRPVKIGQMLC